MKNKSWIAFAIDRGSPTPVFAQIYQALQRHIVSGDLFDGEKLPASRNFAAELGVSRSTVITAYDQLVAEGYAEGRHGSGLYVCPMGEVDQVLAHKPERRESNPEVPAVEEPKLLRPGAPDMRLFPYRQWARAVARVARSEPRSLVTISDIFGDRRLRRAIANHVREWRGIDAQPEQILITAGSGDALEICTRTLIAPGESIALENPGYLPLMNFVESLGINPVRLSVGEQGAELPPSGKNLQTPKLTVLTPSHQFPLGGAMTPQRRLAFLNWAENTGGWILEDDYDSEFRYAGRPIPALAGFDKANRTLYVGSFSKIFSTSLRVGFIVVPKGMTGPFRKTLKAFGTKASIAPQRALATFMEDGEFYRHLRRVRRVYGERRRIMLDRLKQDFADIGTFQDHQAGMQVLLKLPRNRNDVTLCAQAAKQGLGVQALSSYFSGGEAEKGLILGFCAFDDSEIKSGLKRLRQLL